MVSNVCGVVMSWPASWDDASVVDGRLKVDATKAKKTVSAQPMEELKKRDGDGLRGSTKAAGLKTGTREEDRLSLLNIAKFEGGTGKIQAPRPNPKPHKPPQGQQLEPTNNHQPKRLARSRTALGQLAWWRAVVVINPAFPNRLHTPPPCRPSEPNPVRRHAGSVSHQRPRAKKATGIRLSTRQRPKIGHLETFPQKKPPKPLGHDHQQG